jgi:hypothetical protein
MIRNNIAAGKLLVSLLEDRLYGRMGNYLKPDEGLKPSYFGWPQPHHLRQARKLGIRLIFLREWFSLLISTLRFKSYF